MQWHHRDNSYIVILARGEQVMQTLTQFCEQEGIHGGWLSGLGAVNNAEVGFYHVGAREYEFQTVLEDREVISLTGNISLVDNAPFIHAHIVLGDPRLSTVGGHLREATVAVTLEVWIRPFEEPLTRAYAEDVGLNVIDLS